MTYNPSNRLGIIKIRSGPIVMDFAFIREFSFSATFIKTKYEFIHHANKSKT